MRLNRSAFEEGSLEPSSLLARLSVTPLLETESGDRTALHIVRVEASK